jgi:hypothetical protein
MQKLITAAALAIGIGFMAAPATAAPTGSLAGDFRTAAPSTSATEQIARRCWWHRGHRHCRHTHRDYRGYGYGPSINLHIGGHRHGHRHRGHRTTITANGARASFNRIDALTLSLKLCEISMHQAGARAKV